MQPVTGFFMRLPSCCQGVGTIKVLGLMTDFKKKNERKVTTGGPGFSLYHAVDGGVAGLRRHGRFGFRRKI